MTESSFSCIYCGWTSEESNHKTCKDSYKPLYLNNYQMGNLIGMFALSERSPMDKGDFFGEIAIKMQQWCKENGLPMSNNFAQKIDSITYNNWWSAWLTNIRNSNKYQMKIESVINE